MKTSILTLRGWSLQRRAFRCGPLDIDLRPSEVTTLLGPSGIGKTLTMLTALGYVERDLQIAGERIHRGVPLSAGEIPPRALYIPQQSPFNPNWRVRGFLARLPWGNPTLLDMIWPLRYARARRVDEVLASLGLASRKNATVAQLSGGEIQRAALAQVFLLEPQLLVGDEFISALDPGIALWVLEQCREALLRTSGTALFALHDVPSALRISDRLLLLFPVRAAVRPWELVRDGAGWHVGFVYTCLCMARWCTDESIPLLPLLKLVEILHGWMIDPDGIHQFLETYRAAHTVCVLRDGSLRPDWIPFVSTAAAASDSFADMAPIDAGRNQERVVGVSIPRPATAPIHILVSVSS